MSTMKQEEKYYVEKKCQYCHEKFLAYIYNIKKGFGRFCSKRCSNRGNRLGFSKGHPDFRKTDLKVIGRKISLSKIGVKFSAKHKNALSVSLKKYYDRVGRAECRNDDGRRKCSQCIKWRNKVFKRDNWSCRVCHRRGVYLEAHHVKAWSKYPTLRHVLSNGLTLCKTCHSKTDNYKRKSS